LKIFHICRPHFLRCAPIGIGFVDVAVNRTVQVEVAMCKNNKKTGFAFIAVMLFGSVGSARAEETIEEAWNMHFQATYVWQKKPSFAAPYTGVNSLSPFTETSYSFSSTAALGWRPWAGGELYVNPELVQGVPLSGLTGLGGMTNGEQQKTRVTLDYQRIANPAYNRDRGPVTVGSIRQHAQY
jgi:hypothetical protein